MKNDWGVSKKQRISVEIDESLKRSFQIAVLKESKTVKSVITDFIIRYLKKFQK